MKILSNNFSEDQEISIFNSTKIFDLCFRIERRIIKIYNNRDSSISERGKLVAFGSSRNGEKSIVAEKGQRRREGKERREEEETRQEAVKRRIFISLCHSITSSRFLSILFLIIPVRDTMANLLEKYLITGNDLQIFISPRLFTMNRDKRF